MHKKIILALAAGGVLGAIFAVLIYVFRDLKFEIDDTTPTKKRKA